MANKTVWTVWECSQSPSRNRCFSLYSPNWKHNGIFSSCPATCQLFWAGHIRDNWRKTETPRANAATVRSKNVDKQCWTYSDVNWPWREIMRFLCLIISRPMSTIRPGGIPLMMMIRNLFRSRGIAWSKWHCCPIQAFWSEPPPVRWNWAS